MISRRQVRLCIGSMTAIVAAVVVANWTFTAKPLIKNIEFRPDEQRNGRHDEERQGLDIKIYK